MATSYSCDYCHATIDTTSDRALIVGVHRRVDEDEWADDMFVSGESRWFRYRSQEHLAEHMGRQQLPEIDLVAHGSSPAIGWVLLALLDVALAGLGVSSVAQHLL